MGVNEDDKIPHEEIIDEAVKKRLEEMDSGVQQANTWEEIDRQMRTPNPNLEGLSRKEAAEEIKGNIIGSN